MKEVILLVGPPGCGKSTYCNQLNKSHPTYYIISQDDLGKDGHWRSFLHCLENDYSMIVDRMNFSRDQRHKYIEAAKTNGYNVKVVIFDPSTFTFNFCFERCMKRDNHATIDKNDYKTISSALSHFYKGFQWPLNGEKIDQVEIIR